MASMTRCHCRLWPPYGELDAAIHTQIKKQARGDNLPAEFEQAALAQLTATEVAATAIPEAHATSGGRHWWLVIVVALVSTLSAIDRQVLALFVDPIRHDLGLSDVQIGLLMGAAFAVTGMIVGPIAGYLADRICRRCMFGISALLWSVMTVCCGLASSFAQLLVARASLGLFEGVATPATASMLRDGLPMEKRGRGFSVAGMAPMVGTGLSMLLGGALAGAIAAHGINRLPFIGTVHPWQMVFIIFGLIGLPAAALMLTIREPPRGTSDVDQRANASIKEGLQYVVEHWRVYVPLIVYSTLLGMLSLSFAAWLPAMLGRTWHLSAMQIGLTFGVLMLVLSPLGLWISGVAIDKACKRRKDGAAIVGVVATLLIWFTGTLMPLATSPALFWCLLALLMLFSGTAFPVGSTLMAMLTPSRAMGKVIALQGLVAGVMAAVVAPSVVPAVSATIFAHQPLAINYALATTVGAYGLLGTGAILLVLRTVQKWLATQPEGK
jgi:MFS family permease